MPSTRLYHVDKDTGRPYYLDVDPQAHALVTSTNEHHHIHEGKAWDITGTATLDAAGVYRYLFTTEDSDYLAHLRFEAYGEAEGSITLFEGPTVSNVGTTVSPVCRNRDNPGTPRTTVTHTPTTSANGDQIWYGVFGATRVAGSLSSSEEHVLKRGTVYMVVITSDAAVNEITWELFFYEHSRYEDSYG